MNLSLTVPSSVVNSAQATVNFGNLQSGITLLEDTTATAFVSATWVDASSILVCTVTSGPDHSDSDEAAAEGLTANAGDIISGVGFTVTASAREGTWGQWYVNIVDVG